MKPVRWLTALLAASVLIAAAPTRQENLDPKRLDLCLNGSPDDRSLSDIVSEPIKALFTNGATTPVDEILCTSFSKETEPQVLGWFLLNPSAPSTVDYIGKDFGEHGEVTRLAPSPDGKYLAVAYSAEGHPTIEIVDLPALMRDKQYKPLSLVGGYPGYVHIDRWEANALIVKSDSLLHVNQRAALFDDEEFSMDVHSGKLKPLSDELNDPLRYFAGRLRDADSSIRLTAVWGLGELDDQSAVPSLKQALAVEGDEEVRGEIRWLLKRMARTTELVDVCISASPEALRTRKIISETVPAILVDGNTQAIDQTICVIPPEEEWGRLQTWYRVDRSARHIAPLAGGGGGDEVTRLSASANGRFLAAAFKNVDSTRIEIVDLGLLMRSNEYRTVHTIHGFRGSVAVQQWRDNDLHLTSDVFPDHIVSDKGEGDPVNLPLLSPEVFVWRSETATIVPPSGALQDPLEYYCAGITAAKTDGQRIALRGLALMKDRKSVPCLESALSNDTDVEMKAEIRRTIETILAK
jgi:hypothetical protein